MKSLKLKLHFNQRICLFISQPHSSLFGSKLRNFSVNKRPKVRQTLFSKIFQLSEKQLLNKSMEYFALQGLYVVQMPYGYELKSPRYTFLTEIRSMFNQKFIKEIQIENLKLNKIHTL